MPFLHRQFFAFLTAAGLVAPATAADIRDRTAAAQFLTECLRAIPNMHNVGEKLDRHGYRYADSSDVGAYYIFDDMGVLAMVGNGDSHRTTGCIGLVHQMTRREADSLALATANAVGGKQIRNSRSDYGKSYLANVKGTDIVISALFRHKKSIEGGGVVIELADKRK